MWGFSARDHRVLSNFGRVPVLVQRGFLRWFSNRDILSDSISRIDDIRSVLRGIWHVQQHWVSLVLPLSASQTTSDPSSRSTATSEDRSAGRDRNAFHRVRFESLSSSLSNGSTLRVFPSNSDKYPSATQWDSELVGSDDPSSAEGTRRVRLQRPSPQVSGHMESSTHGSIHMYGSRERVHSIRPDPFTGFLPPPSVVTPYEEEEGREGSYLTVEKGIHSHRSDKDIDSLQLPHSSDQPFQSEPLPLTPAENSSSPSSALDLNSTQPSSDVQTSILQIKAQRKKFVCPLPPLF